MINLLEYFISDICVDVPRAYTNAHSKTFTKESSRGTEYLFEEDIVIQSLLTSVERK